MRQTIELKYSLRDYITKTADILKHFKDPPVHPESHTANTKCLAFLGLLREHYPILSGEREHNTIQMHSAN